MSVTLHYSQIREPDLLDVVDDAWAQDKLPNDGNGADLPSLALLGASLLNVMFNFTLRVDIPLPEGLMPPVDETDDLREELEARNKRPDRWVELGLHTVH